MTEELNIIEKILRYLGSLSERSRFSLIDSFLVFLAGIGLILQTMFGQNSVDLQGQIGYWFSPVLLFGVSMIAIFGSFQYCTYLVNRHGRE